jgi:hypothetical protein
MERAGRYIENINVVEGNYLLRHDIEPKTRTIRLVYGGTSLTDQQKEEITARADDFSLEDVNVEFRQGFSYADMALKNSEVETLKGEINRLNLVIREREATLSSIATKQERGGQLLSELTILYPQIKSVSVSEILSYAQGKESPDTLALVVLALDRKGLKEQEKEQVKKWLLTRLEADSLRVVFGQ